MAAPIPYRTSSNTQTTGSFPPPLYYRDTYGFQNTHEPTQLGQKRHTSSITTIESDDTVTTKSTVRTTINIQNPNLMLESNTSKGTANTQSFHVEQMVTNNVLLSHARTLLTLTLVALGSAIQLLVFAVICIFFDGCPYYLVVFASFIFIFNAFFMLYFIRYKPSRTFLYLCIVFTTFCFIIAVALFIWTAYLIYGEDRNIRRQGWYFYKENLLEINRLVSNTRIAMYSLHMVLTPIQEQRMYYFELSSKKKLNKTLSKALCCAGMLRILFENLRSIQNNSVRKGYFITEPLVGHQLQTVLVPIELKQVDSLDESDVENASIGVQTSGNQSTKENPWN